MVPALHRVNTAGLAAALRACASQHPERAVSLVPTMGGLHEGHAGLIRRSVRDGHLTVVSIFVNPTQFGPSEDFDRYPREHDADCALVEACGASVVWIPTVAEIYPFAQGPATSAAMLIDPGDAARRLCGLSRPHFFSGVCTVVMKLFNLCRPHVAYFGEKDWQQLVIIRRMVEEFHLGVDVRGVAIARDSDGLAMSSRNRFLRAEDRHAALALHRTIQRGRDAFRAGRRSAVDLTRDLRASWEAEGLAGMKLDYLEVLQPDTLEVPKELQPESRIFVAAWLGDPPVRLIDNAALVESAAAVPEDDDRRMNVGV